MLGALGIIAIANVTQFRPPAFPLLVSDPYFSVWSASDRLTDSWPRHWTGATMGMCGFVRIDGKTYRFCGLPDSAIPALKQVAAKVEATTTHYVFEGGGARLRVDFFSPAFPDDLDLLSTAVGTVSLSWESLGAKNLRAYVDVSGEWCVDTADQTIVPSRLQLSGKSVLSVGSADQRVLQKSGDDVRIDWGHLYVVPPEGAQTAIASDRICRDEFANTGKLPTTDDIDFPRRANAGWPVLGAAFDVPKSGATLLLAYDDVESLEWFGRPVPAYWRRTGKPFAEWLEELVGRCDELKARGARFDAELRSRSAHVGGDMYADLAMLAYRQAMGAHKLVADIDGQPMMFPKENFSNGCIGTVDVIYPTAPIFLALNPRLLEANLRPVFEYAAMPRWKWPFAPHDLGTYPHANGQVYGGGERSEDNQMPVEECGNMLILAGALAEKGGDLAFLRQFQPQLNAWADFLLQFGADPASQLCTDDFAGHLAHNANLSVKAIVALGAYAKLLPQLDPSSAPRADEIRRRAEAMAKQWMASAAEGDHTKLAFDHPGGWSQKYNLVWDRVLGLHLFPENLARNETAFYKTKIGKYGLPLDNRAGYTKLDWCVWSAWLTGSPADLSFFMGPLWRFANESESRVPLTDWFETSNAKQVGFQARSVVGGVFLPMAYPSTKS